MCVSKIVSTAHHSRFNSTKGDFSRITRSNQNKLILKPNSPNPMTIIHCKRRNRNLCFIPSIL